MKQLLSIIVFVWFAYFVFLSTSTIWATNKSQARTHCYREALKSKQYDTDCGTPSKFEMLIRRMHE